MVSPNVGQVNLSVGITDDDVARRLTRAINDEIKPALKGWHDQLEVISRDIDAINRTSHDQVAREIGAVREQSAKTTNALATQRSQTDRLRQAEEDLATATRDRTNAMARSRRETRRDGQASRETTALIETLTQRRLDLMNDIEIKTLRLQATNQRVLTYQGEDERRYTSAVQTEINRRISAKEDEAKELRRLAAETLKDAEKRSKDEYDLGRRAVKDLDAKNADLARSDKKRTADEQREHNKRARQAKKAAKDQEREARRKAREEFNNSIFEVGASVGKKIGGFAQLGMPVALGAIVAGLIDLVSIASALSGVLGLLPGALAAAGTAMGTFQIATYGVSDAMGALVSGDLEAFAEALALMSPNAQQAMLSLQSLWPELTAIQQAVQDAFFEGFNKDLYDAANTFLPMVKDGLTQLGAVFNDFAGLTLDALMDPDTAEMLQNTIDQIVEGFKAFEPAVKPLVDAFAILMDASSSFLPELANIFTELAINFSDFIREAAATGELQQWIQRGIDAALELGDIAYELIGIFFKMGGAGEGILYTISEGISGLNELLPETNRMIGLFFAPPVLAGIAMLTDAIDATAIAMRGIGNAAIWMYNTVSEVFTKFRPQIEMIYKPLQVINKVLGVGIGGNRLELPDLPPALGTIPYIDMYPDPQLPRMPGARTNLPPWNQRFGRNFPTPGGYDFPGNFPVPAPPEKGPNGKKLSDADKRKAIENSIDPGAFAVDPFAPIGGVDNQPGYPGRPPLNVSIDNLPQMSGLPGMASIPGVPSLPYAGVLPADGANSQIGTAAGLAASLGLQLTAGKDHHDKDRGFHPVGMAGDFSNRSGWTATFADNSPEMLAFAQTMAANYRQYIAELIYYDPKFNGNIKNGEFAPGTSVYDQGTLAGHTNHVHLAIRDDMAAAFAQAIQTGGGPVPKSLKDNIYATNGPSILDPITGDQGYMQVDQQAVQEAMNSVKRAGDALQKSGYELAVATEEFKQGLIGQQDLLDKQNAYEDDRAKLQKEQQDLVETQRGKFKESDKNKPMDYSKLPKGDPRRIMASALAGMGGDPEDIAMLVGGAFGNTLGSAGSGIGSSVGNVAGDVIRAATSVPIPGPMGYNGVPTSAMTDPATLVQQGNPLALAQMAGLPVPDYTRQGAGASGQNLNINGGPPTDAMGRMYSDTAALIDRTFTSQNAEDKARHDQVMAVLNEVKARLGEDLLAPVVEQGMTAALESSGNAIGSAIGEAAGPIIAADVAAAIPNGSGASSAGSSLVTSGANAVAGVVTAVGGFASGGGVVGGIPGKDSVPAMLMPNEYVLTAGDVARMGGFDGVDRFRAALMRQGGVRHYATGGGVNVDNKVGADFFGVSQIPIIGVIVNLLTAVLLKVIDVQIESRDTLNEISSEFRQYRGDFQAFDAAGRLRNDTSGLVDRTGSSTQAAADERIRILKLVLEGLIKYIVEKIIVPIGKAIGNALVQAAAGAAGGAISAAPGGSFASGAVEGVISSAGAAGIDLIAQVGTDFAAAAANIGLDAAGSLIQGLLPGLSNALFGGGLLAALFDPISGAINNVVGGITMLFGGLFGGLASLIPGLPFDQGGVAVGTGLMPKATIAPERVLSPHQTMLFDKMVAALESGNRMSNGSTTTIHAPFTVTGGAQGGKQARDRLLALMS